MSANPQSLGHRIMATGVAAALAMSGAVLAAGAANADPKNHPEFGDINTAATGTINLHKRESGSRGSAGDVFQKSEGGTPVADVTFTYFPIQDLDLTKSEGWHGVSTLDVPANACDGLTAGNTGMLGAHPLKAGVDFTATSAEGETSVSDIPVGAYLICETKAPKTVKKKSAPFVVTMPAPKPTTKGWTYDVHAYPKNTVIQPAKKGAAVDQNKYGIGTGEQVTFTIKAKVPQLSKAADGQGAKDEFFKYFVIADSLHASYVDGVVKSVKIANTEGEEGVNVTQTHYSVNDSANPEGGKKHWIKVAFTADGLAELKKNGANKYVTVTISAKVAGIADGSLSNTGYLMVDTVTPGNNVPPSPEEPPMTPPENPGEPPKPNVPTDPPFVPTNKVITAWGQAKLRKHAADGNKTALSGAVFEVYLAEKQDDPTCPDNTISKSVTERVTVNGKGEFTSGDDGIVEVAGLFIDKAEGQAGKEPVLSQEYRCYVFKEVKAPVGYILPQDKAAQVAVKVSTGPAKTHSKEFQNTQVEVPELPLTGASGTVLATIVGSSLIMLAVGAMLVRRRREAELLD